MNTKMNIFFAAMSIGFAAAPAFAGNYYSTKLADNLSKYVQKQIKKAEATASEEANAQVTFDVSTIKCIGYASWEGNGKSVGVCLIEGKSPESAVTFSVTIGDDTEHPGEGRWMKVKQVSYQI